MAVAFSLAGTGSASAQQTPEVKVTASDGVTSDQFGTSVIVRGDTLFVGAPNHAGSNNVGAVYVYLRSGANWVFAQKLTASDGGLGDGFGKSLASSGDTLIIGAPDDDIVANFDNRGSAYVFIREGGGAWVQQRKLTASDAGAGDFFGSSVAISGETAVVGAFSDDIGSNSDQGSAYVFVRNGSIWSEQQKLTASDGAGSDNFGMSVALAGDEVIIGSPGDDFGFSTDQGSAYVFVRNGTVWSEQPKLVGSTPDDDNLEEFGWSVSISGDSLAIGAREDATGGTTNRGSAFVFVRNSGSWVIQQKLVENDGVANHRFGNSVALQGNSLVVGAAEDDSLGLTNHGSAYRYSRSGATWTQVEKLTADDAGAGDRFGRSVSLDGATIAVGANEDNIGTNGDQGSVYVFATTPPLQLSSAVSRKTHGGLGPFDVPLPLTEPPGVECRSSGGNHTLVFTFTNNVVSGSASVTSGAASVTGNPIFSGSTMTVNLTGTTDVQRVSVTLSGVTDNFAQVLPQTSVTLKFLRGDVSGDANVNAGDALVTRSRSGQTPDGTNFRADVNADGSFNGGDAIVVRAASGNFVP